MGSITGPHGCSHKDLYRSYLDAIIFFPLHASYDNDHYVEAQTCHGELGM